MLCTLLHITIYPTVLTMFFHKADEKVSSGSDRSKVSSNNVCCFGRDLHFLQVVGQIHEIDNESIGNAYLQETIEPQDGLEFVKCASVEAWKEGWKLKLERHLKPT